MGHPLFGPINTKSATLSRASKLFIYYLRCIGTMGTSLMFYRNSNVNFIFRLVLNNK